MRRIAALLAVSAGLVARASGGARIGHIGRIQRWSRKSTGSDMRMGFTGLRPSFSLFVSAELYSQRMMRSDYFGHLSRIPVASNWRAAGETLEWHAGWRLRPRFVVSQWMHSPVAPRRAALQPVQANRRRPHPRQLRTHDGDHVGRPRRPPLAAGRLGRVRRRADPSGSRPTIAAQMASPRARRSARPSRAPGTAAGGGDGAQAPGARTRA